ncbi:MAG TPA: TetR/AcrR family transcriptional regulator [Flavobacteriaceae bacterium]|nr:TetR/AcrR family transcriptional regulator [Flavobacteriaceae bacterium]
MTLEKNRKEEIIRLAAKLFKEKGYRAVTMRDLAETMGIKAASLYNHIRSKQEILALIVISTAESFTTHIDEIYPKQMSSVEKLKKIIHMHVDITVQKTDFLASMNHDWMHLEKKQLVYFLKMRTSYEAKFNKIILDGIQKEELKKHDSEIILFSILTTLRTLHLWYAKKKSWSSAELKEELTAILITGIKGKA